MAITWIITGAVPPALIAAAMAAALAIGYELESQRRELPDPDTDLREVCARRSQVDPAEVVRLDELRRPTREAG